GRIVYPPEPGGDSHACVAFTAVGARIARPPGRVCRALRRPHRLPITVGRHAHMPPGPGALFPAPRWSRRLGTDARCAPLRCGAVNGGAFDAAAEQGAYAMRPYGAKRSPSLAYASKVYVRYWIASATWAGWISSLAARSAMVRATRRMRS